MTCKVIVLAVLPIAVGTLTACGGGGSRSDSPPVKPLAAPPKTKVAESPKPKTAEVPEPKVVSAEPNGKAHFLFIPRTRTGTLRVQGRSDSTGVPIKVSRSAATADVRVDHPSVKNFRGTVSFTNEAATNYKSSTGGIFGSFHHTPSGSLSYSQYGLLHQFTTTTGQSAGQYSGTLTPESEIPKNVTATYVGTFLGFGGVVGAPVTVDTTVLGDVQLNADFGTGTISGQVSKLTDVGSQKTRSYGLSMEGEINGNTYAGTTGFTTRSGTPSGTVTSSAMTGSFYGPKAQETAGALRVEGRPGSGQAPVAIVGGFGAKRK